MLWHLAFSPVPALLTLSVGSGAELLKDAVELYPPMAGPAALLAPLLDWAWASPMARLPWVIPSSCLRRQTGLRNSTQHPGAFQELHELVCIRISVSFLEEHTLLPCCFSWTPHQDLSVCHCVSFSARLCAGKEKYLHPVWILQSCAGAL